MLFKKIIISVLPLFIIASMACASDEQNEKIALIDAEEAKKSVIEQVFELKYCTDEEFGVRFLCNPDWELQTDKGVILIVISQEPAVTMTIARSESPVVLLEQLTNPVLQEMGQYADGFIATVLDLAGEETILIDGISHKYPEVRLHDYYMIRDIQLYSFLFSVNPIERWRDYQELIKKVVKSIEFVES